jgi:hypothetical protein
MARRTAREKLDLFLQRTDHRFMGRPINKTGQSERTFKIFGFEDESGSPWKRRNDGRSRTVSSL